MVKTYIRTVRIVKTVRMSSLFLPDLLVFPLEKLGDRADLSVTSGKDAVVVVADVDDGTCWFCQQSGPSR